ncbi:hypothetical protein, partial [Candidatus Avelusimicrobium aviculae]|uniref:hypothetical protein n=1 Tax=Candidatus Avelusimicrobium aviculae TaxID=3416206 RepID=UPI003D10C9B2
MVNESAASRTRLCQYDKVRGFGNKYDGNINESYDFNSCQWNLTSENCYCSTTRADAPSSGRTSGYEDKTRSCSTDSKWGSKYDGTITARYYYGKGNCYWDQYYDEDCYCGSSAGAPKKQYSGTSTKTRYCSSENSKWTGTITDTYNYDTCSWSYGDNSGCKCAGQPSNLTKEENCPSGYTGSKTYKYNTSLDKCTWELASDTCKKKEQLVWQSNYEKKVVNKECAEIPNGTSKCLIDIFMSSGMTCSELGASSGGSCSSEGRTCWSSCGPVAASGNGWCHVERSGLKCVNVAN